MLLCQKMNDDPTAYDSILHWFLNWWPIALIVIVASVLAAIPSVRDGVLTLVGVFQRKNPSMNDPMDVFGEQVKFEILMTSIDHDVVKIHCHSHHVGVFAEGCWLDRHYPKWTRLSQGLTNLEYLTQETNKRRDFFDSKAFFDLIVIQDMSGKQKKVFFDITDFFTSAGTSYTAPSKFMAEKLKRLYKDKA